MRGVMRDPRVDAGAFHLLPQSPVRNVEETPAQYTVVGWAGLEESVHQVRVDVNPAAGAPCFPFRNPDPGLVDVNVFPCPGEQLTDTDAGLGEDLERQPVPLPGVRDDRVHM